MKILVRLSFMLLFVRGAIAQQVVIASVGDSIRLSIGNTRGMIQWQSSTNGSSWNNIEGSTGALLKFKIVTLPLYLRSGVKEGTCDQVFSSFVQFTPSPVVLPTLTTQAITSITSNSAVSGGNITMDGGSAITARGVVYGTAPNPTLSNTMTSSGSGAGSFVSNITGLTSSTQYYVRAFATNAAGTAYGNQQSFQTSAIPANTILMFVPHDSTYYSEYLVMRKALEASGYSIDLRSSAAGQTSFYMSPSNTTIDATAATLPGGSYAQFTSQFQNLFGSAWNAALNSYPALASLDGRIQDVPNMHNYVALVVVGGVGVLKYRVDGTYSAQGSGDRMVGAADVQSASEKLNQLALDALASGKPVVAQCHGASLPAFWRIPGTSGSGAEVLGASLLKNQPASGFPEAQTATVLAQLGVTYRENDRVTIASPNTAFNDNGQGDYRIITTRDWYPQTVAHAARTLLNILQTYPDPYTTGTPTKVLILHGGAVNPSNCLASNRNNDVPCNFGAGNIPADYTDIVSLLNADSPNDNYTFLVTSLDLTSALPFNNANTTEVLNYYNQFDVVIFFKHWSTGVTAAIQNALVSFADNGGGVLALHHGLYNDIDGALNKNILVNQLFGAESAMAGWSSTLTNYHLYPTNYGHFISTFGVSVSNITETPGTWFSNPLIPAASATYSYYQNFDIYDEIYHNMTFVAGQTFGRGVNQINPLLSNDFNVAAQAHTSGFTKRININGDSQEGKVVYMEIGERKESININHRYGQIVRNALIWLSNP